ncbi:MAG: hypothetical protein ACF8SC_03710 [Phycisphaerales bacterium JB037]
MDPIGPIPIHLARAYGINQPQPTKPVQPVAPVQPGNKPGAVEVRGFSIRPTARPIQTEPTIDTTRARLVSAKVPGGIDFSSAQPEPTRSPIESATAQRVVNTSASPTARADDALPSGRLGSYSIYRHPADRNAAATGVDLGRILDANA